MTEFDKLDNQSRVWIYQSDQKIDTSKIERLNTQISQFTNFWTSHNLDLKAYGKLYYNHFLVLMVDETQAGASGCSIDKSVQFIKNIESEYNLDFFNRQLFYFKEEGEIICIHQNDLAEAYKSGKIHDETLVFNSLVKTKEEFIESWLIPLKTSWHKRFI